VASLNDWALDPELVFLNHGSFGAVPTAVLDYQRALVDHMESNPVRFIYLHLPELLAAARERAAAFVGADPDDFAFVPNATTGTNALLRSAPIEAGDEILVTDHGYEACTLAAEHIASRRGATVGFARIPVPVEGPDQVRQAILDAVTPRTRWAVIDHITSPTALVLPVGEIVRDLADRGVRTIVDGAHAPGQVALDVSDIGAAAYTGNWHKWTSAPKGSGFVWVSPDWREEVRPLVISHGAGHRGSDGERFRATFDWTGTGDFTPYLSVPTALDVVGGMFPGGWPAIGARNHDVVIGMRDRLVEAFDLEAAGPESMTGSMVSMRVLDRWRRSPDPAQAAREFLRVLDLEHGVTVGVATRRNTDDVLFRISAHLHTEVDAVERLIGALRTL
jgi:isopenicillin-N epimerase